MQEVTTEETAADPIPPPEEIAEANAEAQESRKADPAPGLRKKNGYVPVNERDTPLRKAIREGQNKSLRELIDSFGSEGAYLIKVERTHPDNCFDVTSGRTFDTLGHCGKYENKPIDEEYIEKQFGGGVYAVKFHEKKPGGSGWQYASQITIKIPGDPNLGPYRQKAGLAATGAPTPGVASGENPSLVKEAMGMMADAAKRAEERANSSGGGNDRVIEMMREQLVASRLESAELRKELRDLANKPAAPAAPAVNPIQEKMFNALLDGDSARVTQLRTTHDSELRTIKENAAEDIKREQARFDRQMQDVKNAHEREILSMKQSHEISLSATKQSHEVQQAANKAAHDLERSVLANENKRLEKENDRLQAEVKELRAKKELGPVEMMKQVETFKNALGAGDEEETSTAGRVVEAITNPGFFEGVAAVVEQIKGKGNAPKVEEQQQQLAVQKKRQIVTNPAGERFMVMPDGKLRGPLQKKKDETAAAPGEEAAPAEPAMPKVDPGQMAMTLGFLESAYSGGQDPEVVAQGARSRVPDDLLTAIRDHGVDAVMSKMAKLPGSSPLSSIAGKNWLRKLGAALVG